MSRRRPFLSLCGQPDSRPPPSVAAVEGGGSKADSAAGEERWASILPELLVEIVRRVDSSQPRWPLRRSLVSCASVCRRWREVTTSVVPPPSVSGKITFASSLKMPGPRDRTIPCFIYRNKRNSTFYLYLRVIRGLTPFMAKDKFLLAARRYRHGDHIEYIISFDADDFSEGSSAYVGKLRSDFWGTKFTIYDSLPPYDGAMTSSRSVSRRFPSKQISPQFSAGNFEIGQISYKSNLLRSRGPRRIQCILHCLSTRETTKGESMNILKTYNPETGSGSVILNNKAPQWDEDLKCWCLNFHGDVSVASVKNFQLAAAADPGQSGGTGVNDDVFLQFGKIGDDAFSMDYRQPLSAFQAFAICLTSFGTKFACE